MPPIENDDALKPQAASDANILDGNFQAGQDKVWADFLTHIRTEEGALSLAALLPCDPVAWWDGQWVRG